MSKLDNVQEIVQRQDIRADMLKMMNTLAEQSKKQLIKNSPRLETEITKIVEVFMKRVQDEIGAIENIMISVMMDSYTDDEVQALVNFYRDPNGASIMKKSPMVALKSHNVGSAWGVAIMDGVVKDLYPELLDG